MSAARPARYRPASCPLPMRERAVLVAVLVYGGSGPLGHLSPAVRIRWLRYFAGRHRLRRGTVARLCSWLIEPSGPPPSIVFWLGYLDRDGEIRRRLGWSENLSAQGAFRIRQIEAAVRADGALQDEVKRLATRLLRRAAEDKAKWEVRIAADLAALKARGCDTTYLERHLSRR
jgi:hypothetical protein